MDKFSPRWVLGHKVTPHSTTGNFDLVLAETPAHVPGPPPHFHNALKEAFIVIEGELEFLINGEIRVLKAGESIDIPPNTVHTFSNKSDQICKWVNIHSPKGFLGFFEEIGIPVEEQNAQKRSVEPVLIQKVMETAAKYDMVFEM